MVSKKETIMMVSVCPLINRVKTISYANFPRSFILYNLIVVLLVFRKDIKDSKQMSLALK